ncbi:TlpA family protein disulfide reductase [Ferruginibacter sp.]|nr:hypothetical protein [Ferruginibacter sp.]
MKKVIYMLLIFLVSFLTFFILSFLGSYSLNYKLIIGSVLYFFATYYSLVYFTFCNPYILLFLISYPLILINLPINIANFQQSWISLPSTIFLLLSCLSGYFFYKKKIYIIPFFLVLSIVAWFNFGKALFSNKMQYGSFDQTVYFKTPNCVLYDSALKKISLTSLDKTLIIDFWNSRCGPCYRLFPVIDSINKLIDTSRFKIIVANIPLNGEKMENNFTLLNKFNYGFTKLFATDTRIIDSLKIQVYPTTIIISNNNVIFRGDFLAAIKKIKA